MRNEEIFVYVWEYVVKREAKSDFERVYGPDGDWVRLFEKSEGYRGTLLCHDNDNELRYLTVDYWVSKNDRDLFRRQHAKEFEALDRRCEHLTETEHHLGDFSGPARPGGWPW